SIAYRHYDWQKQALMSTEENKAAVRRFWESVNAHNLAVWDEFLAPHFLNHDPNFPTPHAIVSSSFRGLPPIVLGIIANDDQVKDHQATQLIGKGANFIGFGAKLTEEAFQQVG